MTHSFCPGCGQQFAPAAPLNGCRGRQLAQAAPDALPQGALVGSMPPIPAPVQMQMSAPRMNPLPLIISNCLRTVGLSVAAIVFLSIATPAFAMFYPLAAGQHRLPTSSTSHDPVISGTNVVYVDRRGGVDGIYLYNIATSRERRLVTIDSSDSQPLAISGTRIVYADERNGNPDIYCYDLSTGLEKRLTTDTSSQVWPHISGTNVVYSSWQDTSASGPDIYCYDLLTGLERRLTTSTTGGFGGAWNPAISGMKVVYMDNGDGMAVHCYDLTSGRDTRLTATTGDRMAPDISGTRVVYTSTDNTSRNLYCYSLSTKHETRLTTNKSYKSDPAISGTNVVYWDDRNSPRGDIYCYSLTTRRERRLTRNTSATIWASLGGVSGTKVVYSAPHSSTSGICIAELKPAATLGRPVAPSAPRHSSYFRVYGSLGPRHKAGTTVGTLLCDRFYSGAWHRTRTFRLRASDYSTYSQYRTRALLPAAGRWRIRAYHADSTHASSFSSWRYVTVK